MSDLFDGDGFFLFPRTLPSLEGVPDEIAGGYVQDGDGFKLHPDVVAEVEHYDAKLAEAEAEHKAQLAALDAEIASREAQTRELVAGREIREALIAGGVSSGLVSGATKYLLAQFDITLTKDGDDYRATVADSYGDVSVRHAVAAWLQTDEGAAFMPAKPAPDAGRYADAMRTLRATLH